MLSRGLRVNRVVTPSPEPPPLEEVGEGGGGAAGLKCVLNSL